MFCFQNQDQPPRKICKTNDEPTLLADIDIHSPHQVQQQIDLTSANLSNYPIIFTINEEQDLCNTSSATTETITTDPSSLGSSVAENRERSYVVDFDLKQFIITDIVGEALLYKAGTTGLNNCDRDRLCELLVKHLINKYGKLSTADFVALSKKIELTIPNEKSSTYFVAAIPKGISSKKTHEKAKGKLVDKQRNLLYLIKKIKQAEEQNVPTDDVDGQCDPEEGIL